MMPACNVRILRLVCGFFAVCICLVVLCGCSQQSIPVLVSDALKLADIGDDGSWNKALVKLDQAIARGGDSQPLQMFYAIALERSDKAAAAIDIVEATQKDAPDSFLPNYLAGKLNYNAGNYRAAADYLQTAVALDDMHDEALMLYASAAARENLPEVPKLFARLQASDRFDDSYLLWNELAIWYMYQGNYIDAMSNFSKAIRYSNQHPSMYLNTAVMWDRYAGQYPLARRYYERYLKVVGDHDAETVGHVEARLQQLTGHIAQAVPRQSSDDQ